MGPFGNHLADSIFMRSPLAEGSPAVTPPAGEKEQPTPRSPPAMLMEFFPPGTFVRDQQYAMQVLDIDYMAWWKEM